MLADDAAVGAIPHDEVASLRHVAASIRNVDDVTHLRSVAVDVQDAATEIGAEPGDDGKRRIEIEGGEWPWLSCSAHVDLVRVKAVLLG